MYGLYVYDEESWSRKVDDGGDVVVIKRKEFISHGKVECGIKIIIRRRWNTPEGRFETRADPD